MLSRDRLELTSPCGWLSPCWHPFVQTLHSLSKNRLELINSIAPYVEERVLPVLKPVSKCWQPYDMPAQARGPRLRGPGDAAANMICTPYLRTALPLGRVVGLTQ